MNEPRRFTAEFKARVAREALPNLEMEKAIHRDAAGRHVGVL